MLMRPACRQHCCLLLLPAPAQEHVTSMANAGRNQRLPSHTAPGLRMHLIRGLRACLTALDMLLVLPVAGNATLLSHGDAPIQLLLHTRRRRTRF